MLRYQFEKIHRCTLKQIGDIPIVFLQHRTKSICEKQGPAEVELIHVEEMSLWDFIIHIHIYTAED